MALVNFSAAHQIKKLYGHSSMPPAQASERPVNSALAVDLDFERTMKPPPLPTEEHRKSIEDIIKRRVLDLRFDDVVRITPAAPKKESKTVRLARPASYQERTSQQVLDLCNIREQ